MYYNYPINRGNRKMRNKISSKPKVLITDLDNTLVYSSCVSETDDTVCVEYKEGRPVTFMTEWSFNKLKELHENNEIILVPCTMRNKEQTLRIELFRNRIPEYMICDNGAVLYVNGKTDKNYERFINSITRKKEVSQLYDNLLKDVQISSMLQDNDLLKIRKTDDYMIVLLFGDNVLANKHKCMIINTVKKYSRSFSDRYRYSVDGRKLYIVSKYLDKSVAVEYLLKHYKLSDHHITTCGDSASDRKFVTEFGDRVITLPHSVTEVNRTSSKGTADCCDILISEFLK